MTLEEISITTTHLTKIRNRNRKETHIAHLSKSCSLNLPHLVSPVEIREGALSTRIIQSAKETI
jgi:hypothetical protein